MLLVIAVELEHVLLAWCMWLGTVLAWAWSCIYMGDLSWMSIRAVKRWRGLHVIFGPAFLLGTIQLGIKIVPLGVLSMAAFAGLALWYGDYLSQFQRKVLGGPTAEGSDTSTVGILLARIKAWLRDSEGPVIGRAQNVLLFKKNGSLYGGNSLGREQSQAVSRAKKLFETAIKYNATDIHLEPKEGGETQIRYRVDGILQSIGELPSNSGQTVVALLKVLADMDIAERRRPQDGTFVVSVDGNRFDVRSATGPTQFGEKVVLRLLDSSGGVMREGLDSLGMPVGVVQAVRSIIQRSQGMLIVCGPTGSGKTTSSYAALGEVDALSRNIITIENPIEYQLPNVSQIAVNTAAGVTFASILRSVLRQDPDVLLIGEIRDKETAEIAMQAALTGHLVLTTVHANDTATTVTRLIDIGVDATLIQSTVTGILAQRLVRVLCPICKKASRSSAGPQTSQDSSNGGEEHSSPSDVFYKAVGCKACLGTGYRGRVGVFEFLAIDDKIRSLLIGRPSVEAIRAEGKRNGMITLRRAAKQKVIQGLTSVEEARRVVT